MKKKLLSFVSLFMLTLFAVAGEPIYTLTFPTYNDKSISSYTDEWTATVDGAVWTLNGFNNNKNAWSLVKCGRKSNEHTATIKSPVVSTTITNVIITVDATSNVESASLAVFGTDGEAKTTIDITQQFTTGDVDVEATAEAGEYYLLTINSSAASANGPTQISQIILSGVPPVIDEDAPEAPTITPATGTYYGAQQVTIAAAEDVTSIVYTLNDGEEQTYTEPFTVEETTKVVAYAVKGEKSSSRTTATITIGQEYSTAAALNANATADKVDVKFSFEGLLVTYVNGQNVYVADETGGFLIYGTVEGIQAGDIISGSLTGKLYTYNGLPELASLDNIDIEILSSDNEVEAEVVDAADLAENPMDYVSQYVTVKGAQFAADATVTGKKNLTFTVGETELILRNNFKVEFAVEAAKEYAVSGFVTVYNDAVQLYPTSAEDIAEFVTYGIAVAEAENGTVEAPAKAEAGEIVTLTITPAEGYELAELTIVGATSEEAVEYDDWEYSFEMPAEGVNITATFQEAYVKLSNYALASDGTYDEDGFVKVDATFTPEAAGSYTEMFFGDVVFTCDVLDADNNVVKSDLILATDELSGTASAYIADLVPGATYTLNLKEVSVWDYISYVTIFSEVAEEGSVLATATFTTEDAPEIAASNLDFSASVPTAVGIHTYAKDIVGENKAQMQEVENWTMGVENGDARAGAVYAYGSEAFLGGDGYLAPATNPEGEAAGNALGLVAVWSGTVQYTQKVTLQPGNYQLTIPVYNSKGGNSVPVKSLIGFIADNGTEYLAAAKAYPVDEWTNEEISFKLTEKTNGIYTLGYQGQNVGSASAQHLFIDQIKVEMLTDEQLDSIAAAKAAEELAAAKEAALAEIDALPKGYGLFCYDEWGVYDTQEAIEAAEDIAAVDAAVAAYKATQIVPEAETQYVFKLKDGGKYLGADAKLYEEAQKLSFVAVEGGYAITNGTEYVSCTGANAWSMAASAEPYAWVVAPAADGFYRITKVGNAAQGIGVDNTEAGSATYADKAESDKALWTIEEYAFIDINDIAMTVADEPEDGDYGLQTKVSFKYAPTLEGAYANGNVYLSPYFLVGLYQGEEKVKDFEFTSYEDRINGTVADSLVSGYISGFDFGTEYTVKLDSVAFTKFDMSTFESIAVWSKALTDVSQTISYAKPKITIDTDVTAQFGLEPATWTGASGWCAEQFGPYVETNDGRRTLLAENYQGNVNATGDLMYQTLSGLANGTYRIEIYAAAAYTSGRGFDSEVQEGDTDAAEVYAEAGGERKSKPLTAFIATSFSEVNTVALNDVEVTDGTVKIGLTKLNPKTNWHIIQIKGVTATVDAEEALAAAVARAEAINAEEVSEEVYANLQSTVEANNKAYASAEGYIQAIANIDAAVEKANIYKIATPVLAAIKAEIDKTNVYTAEAYEEYYGKWAAKYEAGELTLAEAQALQDPSKVTGWHAAITVDNFLLSAWDTNPDFENAPYYINTWSIEGETDDSGFKVPFFEYWTGDDGSLGEKTLTATVGNLEPGKYEVSAWVRVRAKNGYSAPAYGITLSVNEGEAVDVCAGPQVGESQFYLDEFKAVGEVGEDGVLKIQFNVAADNNISWLSFKNVMFAGIEDIPSRTYAGYVKQTLSHPQRGVMGSTTEEQTVTLAEVEGSETEEGGLVTITFSGFTMPVMGTVIPEFTIENVIATKTANGGLEFAADNFQVAVPMGQITTYYNGTLTGSVENEFATPVLILTLQNATTDVVVFAKTEEEAELATGIATVDTEAEKADGKYLVKGKIVIVKDGKTYNATGVQVK